jgi:CRP-like cAMP-binding protein
MESRSRELLEQLFTALTPTESSVTVEAGSDLLARGPGEKKLYRLREGVIGFQRDGRPLFFIESGDVVDLEEFFFASKRELRSDFAVVVDAYAWDEFLESVRSDPNLNRLWMEFVGLRLNAFLTMVIAMMRAESSSKPEIKSISAGQVIVKEGDKSEAVFTMLEGHAEVFVGKVRVGDVRADEIFGAMGALTGSPRNASVVATKDSLVLSLAADNFIELIHERPATILKLVEDMARTIESLNSQVVFLKSGAN